MRSAGEGYPTLRLARVGLLLSLAAAVGYAESMLLPSMPVPGVKLGLANVVVLVALAIEGPGAALAVSLGKVGLIGVATGGLLGPTSLMGLAGAAAAWVVMVALRARGKAVGPVGWSIGGAAAHVVAQLVAASFLASSYAPLSLLSFALALALLTGSSTGLAASAVLVRLPLLVPSSPLYRASEDATTGTRGEEAAGAATSFRGI